MGGIPVEENENNVAAVLSLLGRERRQTLTRSFRQNNGACLPAHLPLALPCIAAAMMVPVPSGLVSSRAWPGSRPPLRSTRDASTSPLIVKPVET